MRKATFENLLSEKASENLINLDEAVKARLYGQEKAVEDVLERLYIAEFLYEKFPEDDEGALSRKRSYLVRKDTLSLIATHYDIGSKIILGDGERKSGGHRRDSIISDALEALIAVVYIVEGPEETRKFISKVFERFINILPSNDDLKDSKTRLQELLQSHNIELPMYETTEVNKNNKIHFRTLCKIIKI